ncbi:MAG: amino acid permease, partial [Akkermansiaceae bacterium]|nr:amino acid permease [Akkermansiaceae bacterium]
RPIKAWGYPVTPLVFIGVSVWMIVYVAMEKPVEAGWGAVTLGGGLILYAIARGGRSPAGGSG